MRRSLNKIQWKIYRRIKIVWERLNGFDFSEKHSIKELGFTVDEANEYSASPKYDLEYALNEMEIRSTDSILDYGAGKGAAMVTMSKFSFDKIHGVELSRPIWEIGQKNLKKLGLKNTSIFLSNATEFKDLDIYTFFYLYHPFPDNVLELVIQNIKQSCSRRPRDITILYYNPACRRVFDKDPFFKLAKRYPGRFYEMLVYTLKKG